MRTNNWDDLVTEGLPIQKNTVLTSLYVWSGHYIYQALSDFFSDVFDMGASGEVKDVDDVLTNYATYFAENVSSMDWYQLQKMSVELDLLQEELCAMVFKGESSKELEFLKNRIFFNIMEQLPENQLHNRRRIHDKVESELVGSLMRIYQFLTMLLEQLSTNPSSVQTKKLSHADEQMIKSSLTLAVADVLAEKAWDSMPHVFGFSAFKENRPDFLQLLGLARETKQIEIPLNESDLEKDEVKYVPKKTLSFGRLFRSHQHSSIPLIQPVVVVLPSTSKTTDRLRKVGNMLTTLGMESFTTGLLFAQFPLAPAAFLMGAFMVCSGILMRMMGAIFEFALGLPAISSPSSSDSVSKTTAGEPCSSHLFGAPLVEEAKSPLEDCVSPSCVGGVC